MRNNAMQLPPWIEDLKTSPIQKNQPENKKSSLISFSVGLPDNNLIPLEDIIIATNKAMKKRWSLQYSKPLESLKQKIVCLMQKRGIVCNERQVVLTTGSQQGIYLLGKLFIQQNNIILLEEKLYPNVILALKAYAPKVITLSTDLHNGINVDEIELALKQGVRPSLIYIISDGHNPIGVSINKKKRIQLAQLALKYKIPIIEDDAYGFINYERKLNKPVKYYASENVFYLGSFSKMLTPALRLGWMIVPEKYTETLEIIKESLDLNVSNLSQHILDTLLSESFFEKHLEKIIKHYKEKRDIAIYSIKKYFPQNTKYSIPTHGFFIWVNFPNHIDAQKLFEICSKTYGVSFLTGNDFATGGEIASNSSIRLSFASCGSQNIQEGIVAISKGIRKLYGDI